MSGAPRVVFDCNIFLQALSAPKGPAGQCVKLAFSGKVQLFVSPAVLSELEDVTNRSIVIKKLKLVPERVEEFLEAIEAAATILADFPQPFVYPRDPDDAKYVNLAIAADATYIVSRDNDLLDLMNRTTTDGIDFQKRNPSIRIVEPVEFLSEVQTS